MAASAWEGDELTSTESAALCQQETLAGALRSWPRCNKLIGNGCVNQMPAKSEVGIAT